MTLEREIRIRLNLTLDAVAREIKLTKGHLSELENGNKPFLSKHREAYFQALALLADDASADAAKRLEWFNSKTTQQRIAKRLEETR